ARGERMVAMLNQPQYEPWPVEEQVAVIQAGTRGYLDAIPPAQVPRFQQELCDHLRAEGSVLEEIRESQELSDDLSQRLDAEIEKVLQGFHVEEDRGLVG
ncbi:MAG: F0F1 ATP synthase subunit alpha, partial [Gaiellaceae bacterium]